MCDCALSDLVLIFEGSDDGFACVIVHCPTWFLFLRAVMMGVHCQIKLRSLQSIRLSTSTDGCAFGPRKASKVEKPSSRGVSSLHRWSLMLLPVLWLIPCALCTHVSVSTQRCVAATLLLLPRAGTHDSDGPLGLNVVTY